MVLFKLIDNFVGNNIKFKKMGKGDQKTKRGKITRGSYGKTRLRKKTSGGEVIAKEAPKKEKPKATQPKKVAKETEATKEAKPKTTRAKKTTEEATTPKPKTTKTKKTEE